MSISELETPTVSTFVGTSGPDLGTARRLGEQAALAAAGNAAPGPGRRTISDGRYAAARIAVDFVSTYLALAAALVVLSFMSQVPANSINHFWSNISADALFPFAVVLAIAIGGTYRTNQGQLGSSLFKELKDVLFAVSVGCVITLTVGTYLHAVAGAGRPVASQQVVAVVLAVAFISVGRVILRASLHTLTVTRVLIVGTGALTDRITTFLGLRHGVEIVGHVVGEEEADAGALGTVDDLPALCRDLNVQQVIVGFPSCHSEKFVGIYRQLQDSVHIAFVPRYFELVSFRARLADLGGLPLLEVARPDLSGLDRFLKRSFDIVASLSAIIVLSPIMAVTAIAIRSSSSGKALFRQTRIGQGGREFTVLKFRTMTEISAEAVDATTGADEASEAPPATRVSHPLHAVRLKHTEVQRITGVGKTLRKSRLDELPQLLNVLKGDMSIVGPRPFVPHESTDLDGWAASRFAVRPGITGLWQVSGSNDLSTEDLHQLDHLYVSSWSFWWDLKIMLDTPKTMLHGIGAY
ncbi:MAG TPA: sugar transferase [Acidimicrobiales bacterium]|nr:sugar transferase [Acidimicrobiales bacterium]